jgi:hypothetical protein
LAFADAESALGPLLHWAAELVAESGLAWFQSAFGALLVWAAGSVADESVPLRHRRLRWAVAFESAFGALLLWSAGSVAGESVPASALLDHG